jgi:metal-responsive CopG/Arc/MetJ family transcriptional regulator
MVRLNVTISDDLAATLDAIAAESETSKSEIFRKALTLYEVAREGRREGKRLTMVDREGRQVTEIVGL